MGIFGKMIGRKAGPVIVNDPATQRKSFTFYSGYDATKPKGRRQAPTALVRDEDRELPPASRRAAVSATRDIHRNFAVAAWALRRHLDYVTKFRFKSKTGNKDFDLVVTKFIRKAAKRQNFDVAGRHSLARAVRMMEARKIVDGDVFCLKLSSGKIQWLEGDRIRTPYQGLPGPIDVAKVNHGVIIDQDNGGRATGYVLCRRAKTNDQGYTGQDMVFERVLPAMWVYHHACWDLGRFDQVRGNSQLLAAYNTFRDTYEALDMAMVKMKVATMLALVTYRDAAPEEGAMGQVGMAAPATPIGQTAPTTQIIDGATSSNPGPTVNPEARYTIDMGKGPIALDLDAGDKADLLESHTPSTEFQQFVPLIISIALKSLDIPYNWFDEKYVNFSGGRQAWINYEKSADVSRRGVQEFLDDWAHWRLSLAIDDGDIKLPAGMVADDVVVEWRTAGTPWLDPLKEVLANAAAVEGGFDSPSRVIERMGDADEDEILDEIAESLEKRKARNLPPPAWALSEKEAVQGIQEGIKEEPNQLEPDPNEKKPVTNGSKKNGKSGSAQSFTEKAMALALTEREERLGLNGEQHD